MGRWVARARSAVGGLAVAVALTASDAPLAASGIALSADAGLGGLAKPGRWMPVRVVLRSDAAALPGTLVVEWGSAVLRRPVQIAAGATQTFELYLQTMEVGASVSVRLEADGAEIASATVPVRTLRVDEPFVLCVGPATAGACTATQQVSMLPRSMRGFDAADRVEWSGGDETMLRAEQQLALARWRALRALDESGSLGATDRPRSILPAVSRLSRTGRDVQAGTWAYLLALVGSGVLLGRRRARLPVTLGALAAVTLGGSAAAMAVGAFGPGAAVVVHHATLVQQLAGARGSLVTVQGAAVYPALDDFAVHAVLDDASLETVTRRGEKAMREHDENGYPVMKGRFGLGDRRSFTLSGVSDYQPLALERRGPAFEVINRSQADLTDCRFGDGTIAPDDGLLRAGGTVSIVLEDPIIGPVITCESPLVPVAFTEPHREVRSTGRTMVAAYARPPVGAAQ